ncbi:tagatose 1,6-diphosphate aldolase [uncultured Sneathia sp.]|uniref:tagatose 1,6-diphosphate aldolase n=1 Tax=uncultured Sneathia sp. TaxID=278067 RepID=UPI002803CC64|nr:tagatose 1,6-diphosphate aldolase [uncultured Sneathia sp.]
MKISEKKYEKLEKLSNEKGIIGALAIDQRGSIKKMMSKFKNTVENSDIVEYKKLISKNLSPFASAILLDPEYGLEASQIKDKNCGLLFAYEKTGYDATRVDRLPDILDEWSVVKLKNEGADAIKFLLYYDIDGSEEVNKVKHAFIERLGSECAGEDIPFFLELLCYSEKGLDKKEYAKVRPHKVISTMKEFSKGKYKVDVLKVEMPIDMNLVKEYSKDGEYVYTEQDAIKFLKEQSDATDLPYIFLSGGVSMDIFEKSLSLAKKAKAKFNGVLCGRATWQSSVEYFAKESALACEEHINNTCQKNILSLNKVLNNTATNWKFKLEK